MKYYLFGKVIYRKRDDVLEYKAEDGWKRSNYQYEVDVLTDSKSFREITLEEVALLV